MAFSVIAAAGSGDRLCAGTAKFEVTLLGRPMILFSLEAFQKNSNIESIVLVVPAEHIGKWSAETLEKSGIDKAVATVAGGASRQESVRLGLEAIGCGEGVVAVHDAARPMVTEEMVSAVCRIPAGMAGLVTAVPVTDTIKQTDGWAVVGTIDRSRLVSVQTPQAFNLATLLEAHEDAHRSGFEGTDDASLVERIGGRVGIVEGSRENIKVTYGADVVMAEAILSRRGLF